MHGLSVQTEPSVVRRNSPRTRPSVDRADRCETQCGRRTSAKTAEGWWSTQLLLSRGGLIRLDRVSAPHAWRGRDYLAAYARRCRHSHTSKEVLQEAFLRWRDVT